jgi:hypothetical protein
MIGKVISPGDEYMQMNLSVLMRGINGTASEYRQSTVKSLPLHQKPSGNDPQVEFHRYVSQVCFDHWPNIKSGTV